MLARYTVCIFPCGDLNYYISHFEPLLLKLWYGRSLRLIKKFIVIAVFIKCANSKFVFTNTIRIISKYDFLVLIL